MKNSPIPSEIKTALSELVSDLRSYFGDDLSKVVLYGSYARGEYKQYSDVDILVLLKSSQIKEHSSFVVDLTAKYLTDKSVLFSILLYPENDFNHWKDSMDLFVNIEEDGILVI